MILHEFLEHLCETFILLLSSYRRKPSEGVEAVGIQASDTLYIRIAADNERKRTESTDSSRQPDRQLASRVFGRLQQLCWRRGHPGLASRSEQLAQGEGRWREGEEAGEKLRGCAKCADCAREWDGVTAARREGFWRRIEVRAPG